MFSKIIQPFLTLPITKLQNFVDMLWIQSQMASLTKDWNKAMQQFDERSCLHNRVGALTSRCPPTWRQIAQTDLDIQGSHAHHARMRSSCAWTTNGGVHGETVTHINVERSLHKWILISVAIEAVMLEDSMTSVKMLYSVVSWLAIWAVSRIRLLTLSFPLL